MFKGFRNNVARRLTLTLTGLGMLLGLLAKPVSIQKAQPGTVAWASGSQGTLLLGNNMLKRAADARGKNNKERRRLRTQLRRERDAMVARG